MTRTDPILDRVRALDPERPGGAAGTADPDRERLAETTLQRILTADTANPCPTSPRTSPVRRTRAWVRERSRRPAVRWALPAVVATAVVVGLVLPSPQDTAFATWTAVPDTLVGEDEQRAVSRCAEEGTDVRATQDDDPAAGLTRHHTLAERRGEYEAVVLHREGWAFSCVLHESGAVTLGAPSGPSQVGVDAIDYALAGTSSLGDHGQLSSVTGRAGRDVVRVDLAPTGHEPVRATVQDGAWAAWWPGRFGESVLVTVHLRDGTVQAPVPLDTLDVPSDTQETP